jgi:exosortase H (IPTLxxWG-CTERM-specific)
VPRPQLRFILKFFGLLVVFYLVVAPEPVDKAVIAPATRAITAASTLILRVVGQQVQRTGTVIHGATFAVDIKNGCNGIEAVVFLCAAILAFPAPWRARGLGLLASIVVIQVLNIIRIAVLYLIGVYDRPLFDMFHLGVWQSIIFGAAVLIFLTWTRRVQPHVVASR